MRIGIIGYGVVGKSLQVLLDKGKNEIVLYDSDKAKYPSYGDREAINSTDLAFICIPTPADEHGQCDLDGIVEVMDWIDVPVCIKSTIPPGTVDRLREDYGKRIVFSPEYTGETPFHRYKNTYNYEVVIVGGDQELCDLVINTYRNILGPEPRYFKTDAITAELVKYMENCFFATKVAFVAQFYTLAETFGADFTLLREAWCADTRVGRSHSTIIDAPGFGGKCLPKDMSAIIHAGKKRNVDCRMLEAILAYNRSLRSGQ